MQATSFVNGPDNRLQQYVLFQKAFGVCGSVLGAQVKNAIPLSWKSRISSDSSRKDTLNSGNVWKKELDTREPS